MVADCPKFIPNIFNNTKCSSCFKTREEHGDVALDSKGLRKVVKCGYLFVAPRDWDFCNPALYRAKRWQRRWFVLWSDDTLTWSIDDQPDTIPQGTLDMREILEVKSAEEITENPYSLALTGKGATFIKGMNNEDIKSWQSILTKYGNRLINPGNGKRSLTLPGGFGGSATSSPRFETGVVIGPSRPRFHSVTTTTPISPGLSSPVSPTAAYGKCSSSTTSIDFNPKPFEEQQITSTSTTKSSSMRSIYVSLSNVPKGKNLRGGFFQSSSPPEPTRLMLSSTILPPSASSTASPTEEEIPPIPSPSVDFNISKSFSGSVDVPDCPTTNSVRALRGDPDGCGGLEDGGPLRKGWLLRQTNNDWTKHWFVLQNNSLLYYENSEETTPLGNIEINESSVISQFESSRHYGFEVSNKSLVHKLSAITNGMRGIWMKALEAAKINKRPEELPEANPPSPPLKSKKSRWRKKTDLKAFESLKDEFSQRESELENLRSELRVENSPRMRELLKSQSLQIDNFRTQLSAGFLEIEKLEHVAKSREGDYAENLKAKELLIDELKTQLASELSVREQLIEQSAQLEHRLSLLSHQLTDLKRILRQTEAEADAESIAVKELESLMAARNTQLSYELELLKTRTNDLTEKLYQSEKSAKSLKNKLGRVKSQSLKDRQIESDVLNKIVDLEEKISKLDSSTNSCPESPSSGPLSLSSPLSPTPGASSGIVNVIMKLNDLDQRVDKAVDSYWFRKEAVQQQQQISSCSNCQILELEVQEREERLEALEDNLMALESDFNAKVKELKEFVKEVPGGGGGSESSPTTAQAVSKYQAEIEQLRNLCAKGLEAMENSHRRMVLELEEKHRRELQALKMEKENELAEETKATLSALDAMRKNHAAELQKEIAKFKEDFLKKFNSGQDLSDMHREHEQELSEVKDEILRLSEKYSLKCVEASQLEENVNILKQQLNQAKRRILDMEGSDFQSIISSASAANKKPDQVTALRSRLEHLILSRSPLDDTKAKAPNEQSGCESPRPRARHSITRSPSCPKLGEARLTIFQ